MCTNDIIDAQINSLLTFVRHRYITEKEPDLFHRYYRDFLLLRGQVRNDRLAALANGYDDETGWGRQDTLQASALLLGRQVVVFRMGQGADDTPVLYRLTYSPNPDAVRRLFTPAARNDAADDEEIHPNAIIICEDGIDHFAAVIPLVE